MFQKLDIATFLHVYTLPWGIGRTAQNKQRNVSTIYVDPPPPVATTAARNCHRIFRRDVAELLNNDSRGWRFHWKRLFT